MSDQISSNDGAQSGASLPPRTGSALEYYERLGIVKTTAQVMYEIMKTKIAKCEECGVEQEYKDRQWPTGGWSQCGHSKYGDTYLKSRIGWWCPLHKSREFLEKAQAPNDPDQRPGGTQPETL